MSGVDRSVISENISGLRADIHRAAVKAGRSPADIEIVAVTKNVPVENITVAVEEGILDLGENRVQELVAKQPHLGQHVRWHLIGHLQTNKVRAVVGRIKLIHSLDSWRLAAEIDRRSGELAVVTAVLIQVNVSGEETKYGLNPEEVPDFIKDCAGLGGISIRGLMTVAPYVDDPEEVRPVFRDLRIMFEDLRKRFPGVPMSYLSMGMTNDYLVAVEEGANILRVGSGIFGERPGRRAGD